MVPIGNASPYEPLQMPGEVEDALLSKDGGISTSLMSIRGAFSHLWRRFLDSLRPPKLSRVRIELENQLKTRDAFPQESWESTNLPMDKVSSIIDMLASRMVWPNSYFVPSDPIQLLLCEEHDEFGPDEFFLDLRDVFRVTLTPADVEHICREEQTLAGFIGDFINICSQRRKGGWGKGKSS